MRLVAWFLVPFLLVGCKAGQKQNDVSAREAQAVSVVTATPSRISESHTYNGTVAPKSEIKILPKLQGRVLSAPVDVGDRVSKGELLALIETPEFEWQLQQQEAALLTAEATHEKARTDHARMEILLAEGAISQQQYDGARTQARIAAAQVKQVKAVINQVRAQLANGRVTAPLSGTITARQTSEGAMAAPGQPMFTLAEDSDMRVLILVPERDLSQLQPGNPVTVTSPAFPRKRFSGTVARINPAVDPQTRLLQVEVDLPGSELRSGMFVQATIEGDAHAGLVVPVQAVQGEGDSAHVFLVNGTTVKRIPVQLGARVDSRFEVRSGLDAGAKVVSDGSAFLADGDTIVPMTD